MGATARVYAGRVYAAAWAGRGMQHRVDLREGMHAATAGCLAPFGKQQPGMPRTEAADAGELNRSKLPAASCHRHPAPALAGQRRLPPRPRCSAAPASAACQTGSETRAA